MKAVVGVGYMKHCLAGLAIFAKLKFPNSEAVLVHTVEPVLPDGGFMPASAVSPIVDIQRQRQEDGEARMAEVAAELKAKGIPCRTLTTFGRPAHEITEVARTENADIVIGGSDRKGALESFIMGSVTRALVSESQRSILIGKTEASAHGKVDAVFATDHSDYANKCIDLLVRFAPMGLGKVTVLFVDTSDPDVWRALEEEFPEPGVHEAHFQRLNNDVCAKLRPVCDSVESRIVQGDTNDSIDQVMKETGADLLIVGAHGHGFLERLVMGSTAMYMVGNAPWNVLVLRV